jgi:23S rRNA (cytidine1920-2'-O)/16S rRNA (cytidine1409-2'-O)-methyltransferase
MKKRLDQTMVSKGLVASRSQAESYVKLGYVKVNGQVIQKAGHFVGPEDKIILSAAEQYVSRAALKLASVAQALGLDFNNKTMLDVGSSTGGFTDYALRRGAQKVIAIDVGTDQLHSSLRDDARIELHEKTDIRSVEKLSFRPDIVVIDVSFISLREVLPHIAQLVGPSTQIVAMVKPQFEAGSSETNKGVIKNDTMRRKILKDFETWTKKLFIVIAKADSEVSGAKGNRERFYLLKRV